VAVATVSLTYYKALFLHGSFLTALYFASSPISSTNPKKVSDRALSAGVAAGAVEAGGAAVFYEAAGKSL